ncbi:MAG: hypothetical protein QW133_00935 [Sulfolobales archaeon]
MKFHEISGLVLCAVSFNILVYILARGSAIFPVFSVFYVIVLALLSTIIYKDVRKGLAVTYFFLAVAFIYVYGTNPNLTFKFAFGSYLMLIIPLISSLTAGIIVLRGSRESFLAYVLIILSLPATFLDFGGLLPIALMSPHFLLFKTIIDGLRFACVLFLTYLPYVLLPTFIADISVIPYPNLFNVLYGVRGEYNLLIAMMAVITIFLIFDVVYLKYLRHHLPKLTEPKYLLHYSLTSYFASLAMLTSIFVITVLILKTKPEFTNMLYASIHSLPVALFGSSWILTMELTRLKWELSNSFNRVRDELTSCISVFRELIVDPVLGIKVSKYRDRLEDIGRQLNTVKEFLSKPTLSSSSIENMTTLLEKLSNDLTDIRNQIVSTYHLTVKEIEESYNKVARVVGSKDMELDELIRVLGSIQRFEDIPSVSIGLSKALKSLCESYVRSLNELVRLADDLLGIKVGVEPSIPCSEVAILLNTVGVYGDILESLLSSNEFMSKTTAMVEKALNLSNSINKVVEENSSKINVELLKLLKELSTNLKSYQQEGITVKALADMRNKCSLLRSSLTRLSDLVSHELSSKDAYITNIASSLGLDRKILMPITPSVISKHLKDLTAFQDISTCCELIDWTSSKFLGLIYEYLFYIETYDMILRAMNYLPLLIKYFDERLKRGVISLDDVPLSKDVLRWFVNVYISIKSDVVLEGNILKRVEV